MPAAPFTRILAGKSWLIPSAQRCVLPSKKCP
ncbi:hypothetical protein PANA5342_0877 [Pantoea ananatis LMG 5342]|nr:hypothetical protein PANA5342_0877 [Pantoea ananatis LMG 5342]